jgi:tRNA/tmRNA/rRNA uracil-C5-methylase (TrmA/RlmC/RlmD family)
MFNLFFQPNPQLLPKLLIRGLAPHSGGENPVDVYAGIGLFALELSECVGHVDVAAIERHPLVIEAARRTTIHRPFMPNPLPASSGHRQGDGL